MKSPQVNGTRRHIQVSAGDVPVCAKRKSTGDSNRAAIGKCQAHVVNAKRIAVQPGRHLDSVQRQRRGNIGKGQRAVTNAGGYGQFFDHTAGAKAKFNTAIGDTDKALILARPDIHKHAANDRAQIKRHNLEPRAGAVDAAGNLEGEVREITAGKPLCEFRLDMCTKTGRPVRVNLIDRPSVATKPKGKLGRGAMQRIHVTRQRYRSAIGKRQFTLCQ